MKEEWQGKRDSSCSSSSSQVLGGSQVVSQPRGPSRLQPSTSFCTRLVCVASPPTNDTLRNTLREQDRIFLRSIVLCCTAAHLPVSSITA
jgi:hypothetical protein